jgi:hypothetical protein
MREEAAALQAECESYALRNSPDGRRNAMRRALDAAYAAGFAAGNAVRQAEYDRLMTRIMSMESEHWITRRGVEVLRDLCAADCPAPAEDVGVPKLAAVKVFCALLDVILAGADSVPALTDALFATADAVLEASGEGSCGYEQTGGES